MKPRDSRPRPADFVDLARAVPGVRLDLKYATADNFTGAPLPGCGAGRAWLTRAAARGLASVQEDARAQGLGLLVFDAYRPQRAVDRFLAWTAEPDDAEMRQRFYPRVPKAELFHRGYLSARSAHSRGSTVDLTLVHGSGRSLDMGTEFDLFDERSHTASAAVTTAQRANRDLLQGLMAEAGFRNYWMEWWHFTLENEPYPATYFDFSVD